MSARAKIIPIEVIFIWPAPQPKPVAITKNKYTSSSGSFIAALNLTIDRAPTNPSDNAREDFTIVITSVVASPKIINIFENSYLLEREFENLR